MVEDFLPCDPNCSEVYLASSPGYGIIDSGCGKTLMGQSTLNALFRKYSDLGQPLPTLRSEEHLFRFGNQNEELAQYAVTLPLGIGGRAGVVDAAIIKGTAPLLLSRSTMRSLGAVLDFQKGDPFTLRCQAREAEDQCRRTVHHQHH